MKENNFLVRSDLKNWRVYPCQQTPLHFCQQYLVWLSLGLGFWKLLRLSELEDIRKRSFILSSIFLLYANVRKNNQQLLRVRICQQTPFPLSGATEVVLGPSKRTFFEWGSISVLASAPPPGVEVWGWQSILENAPSLSRARSRSQQDSLPRCGGMGAVVNLSEHPSP